MSQRFDQCLFLQIWWLSYADVYMSVTVEQNESSYCLPYFTPVSNNAEVSCATLSHSLSIMHQQLTVRPTSCLIPH